MKPLHIGLLVAAAALGGALFMKVVQKPQAPTPATVAAEQQPIPAQPVAAQPAAPEAADPAPSPIPEKASAKPARRQRRHVNSDLSALVAQNEPPAMPQAAPAPAAPTEPQASAPPAAPAVSEPEAPPAPPPPPPQVTLGVGTMVQVRLVDGLATDRNQAGDTFSATLDQPLAADGFVIAERGARVEGRIVNLDESGRTRGLAQMGIALTSLHTSDGQKIPISTDTFTKVAPKTVKRDVERGAAATGIGAAIGAIAGGGKGAGIGAAVGAAAGVGGAMATRGDPVRLPTETRITFRLSAPVTITERR